MRLLVLAGGFGTRLKSAIGERPKALAPIADIPFLYMQLENWLQQGIRKFSFLLHHQAGEIIEFLQSQKSGLLKECDVDWLIEPMPMDTGGAVANAVRELKLKGDFLVTNADTWLGSGMTQLIYATSPSIAVINLTDVSRYGQVEFDQSLFVTKFSEKSESIHSGWINAGTFYLNTQLFDQWNGHPFSLERELFVELVKARKLKAVPLKTDFLDIGVPDDYRRFCMWIENGRNASL